ncbi:gliding motility-associated C-terminal domain-containing protein [Aquiflexum sp. TKW24L]|nr:gliding motility-associated C-terminal domain-containing protein [Aquiflexum sp. TKW24L]
MNVSASESVTATQSPALSITKTATESTFAAVGDVLNYTIVVTNTGNVTLNNISVTDPLTGLNTVIGTLAPLASESIPTSYTVTQTDLDNGFVTNRATASGVSTNDEPVEDSDEITVVASENPSIEVIKTTESASFSEIGQVVTYTITVKNTGNVTLTNLLVSDPLTGLAQIIPSLAPGQSIAITTEYTVQLEDLNVGSITNNVSVTTKSRGGNDIGGNDSVTIGASSTPIDAIDDDLGDYPADFGGVLGNILTNDLLDNKPVNYTDVNFEFTDLDGVIGLLIQENGELSLIPGLNEAREYRLKYTLREALNPTNSDEATVVFELLENEVDLRITKTSKGIEIYEGDEFEYEIEVSNIGETDAKNVVIIDDLPRGLSYIGTTTSESNPSLGVEISVNGSKITYTIPLFPAGSSLLIKIKVRAEALNSDQALSITNLVRVSADEEDLNLEDNEDSDTNQINPFFIPTVITPNGDGLNDRFEIMGLRKFETNDIVIFNRNGDHVFERKNYENDWSAEGLVAGTYFFVMKSTDKQGKLHEFQGWIQVIKR